MRPEHIAQLDQQRTGLLRCLALAWDDPEHGDPKAALLEVIAGGVVYIGDCIRAAAGGTHAD